MTKFTFNSEQEREQIVVAVMQGLPDGLLEKFASFMVANTDVSWTKMAAGRNETSHQTKGQLFILLQKFLEDNGLSQNDEIQEYIQGVVNTMGAYFKQYPPKPVNQFEKMWNKMRGMYPAHPKYDAPETVSVDPNAGMGRGQPAPRKQPVFTRNDEAFYGKDPMALFDPLEDPQQPGPQMKKVTPPTKPVYTRRPMGAPGAEKMTPAGATQALQRKEAMPNYDEFIASLLKLADEADEAGMTVQADRIASVLPLCKTVRLAQYEGFQNYWIANGRAFEQAWKEKRSKGKEKREESDFRSAHDCWFEVLEEYQKSLLTNQKDFISKYASRGEDDAVASRLLLDRISEKVASGSSAGVAFYEAIDEMAGGKHAELVLKAVTQAVMEVKKQAEEEGNAKIAAQADEIITTAGALDSIWQGVRNVGDFFRGIKVPRTVDLAQEILRVKEKVLSGLERVKLNLEEAAPEPETPAPAGPVGPTGMTPQDYLAKTEMWTKTAQKQNFPRGYDRAKNERKQRERQQQPAQPEDPRRAPITDNGPMFMREIENIIAPVYQNLQEYVARERLVGMQVPKLPNLYDAFTDGKADHKKLETMGRMIAWALEHVTVSNAKQIDAYIKQKYPKGLPKPAVALLEEANAPKPAEEAKPEAAAPTTPAEAPKAEAPAGTPPPTTPPAAPAMNEEGIISHIQSLAQKDKVAAGVLVWELTQVLSKIVGKAFMTDDEIKAAIDVIRKKRGIQPPGGGASVGQNAGAGAGAGSQAAPAVVSPGAAPAAPAAGTT